MNWYPLRVISGKESKVKDNLLFELDYQNLNEEVEDILIPSENIVEMKDGKKEGQKQSFFPWLHSSSNVRIKRSTTHN